MVSLKCTILPCSIPPNNESFIYCLAYVYYYAWKDNIADHLGGQNLWHVTMGEEEIPVVLVAAGQVIPTEGAVFEARCQLPNYLHNACQHPHKGTTTHQAQQTTSYSPVSGITSFN
jgi:hypothetical protein